MHLHITIDQGVDWAARKLLTGEERMNELLPYKKKNLLGVGFNVATALLVAAVVSPIFLSFAAALVLGVVAVFGHIIIARELRVYEPLNVAQGVAQGALNMFGVAERHVEIVYPDRWEENAIVFDRYPLWKNMVPYPREQ